MKAFILAAGFGTRLKPWTDRHPKALVPVGGMPMLQRVIERMRAEGFDHLVINVHHFADQIKDFIASHDFGVRIDISDESDRILDTGGGLLKAAEHFFSEDSKPFLVHNVDILSDIPLAEIMRLHQSDLSSQISLVTSPRESSRQLVFNSDGALCGWHNINSGEFRPDGFRMTQKMHQSAFSGIYVLSPSVLESLKAYSRDKGTDAFPVIDFFLEAKDHLKINEIKLREFNLIDIGKPETLRLANLSLMHDCDECDLHDQCHDGC